MREPSLERPRHPALLPHPQRESLAEDREAQADALFTGVLHVQSSSPDASPHPSSKQEPYRSVFASIREHTQLTVPAGHTHCGAMCTVRASCCLRTPMVGRRSAGSSRQTRARVPRGSGRTPPRCNCACRAFRVDGSADRCSSGPGCPRSIRTRSAHRVLR